MSMYRHCSELSSPGLSGEVELIDSKEFRGEVLSAGGSETGTRTVVTCCLNHQRTVIRFESRTVTEDWTSNVIQGVSGQYISAIFQEDRFTD